MKRTNGQKVVVLSAIILVFVAMPIIIIGIHKGCTDDSIYGYSRTPSYYVTSKLSARVDRIYVAEGDNVNVGDTLAILSVPGLEYRKVQVIENLLVAEAELERLENGMSKEEIDQALYRWNEARAYYDAAEKEYAKIKALCDSCVATVQSMDEAKAKYEMSIADERAAYCAFRQAFNACREEDKRVAEANNRQIKGKLDEVEAYLKETILIASRPGCVTDIFAREGEIVNTGGSVLRISQHEDLYFVFLANEDKVNDIHKGSDCDVIIPSRYGIIESTITNIKDVGVIKAFTPFHRTDTFRTSDKKLYEITAKPKKGSCVLQSDIEVILLP